MKKTAFFLLIILFVVADVSKSAFVPRNGEGYALDINRRLHLDIFAYLISDTAGTNARYEWMASQGRVFPAVTINGVNRTRHACPVNAINGSLMITNRVRNPITPNIPALFGKDWTKCPTADFFLK